MARVDGDVVVAELDVTNRGEVAGDDIALLYITAPGVDCQRPRRQLKGFVRANLAPGETRRVMLKVACNELRWWNPAIGDWATETGDYRLLIGDQTATITL